MTSARISGGEDSPFDVFCEHFFGVDGDEDAAAAGEDFSFFVEDFGRVDVRSSVLLNFASFDAERLLQRDRLEIFDGHLASKRDDLVQLVHFAHSIVEDRGDDATVAVAGRSGVALGETKAAYEGLAFFVEDEFEVHAVFVVRSADEAVVLLGFVIAGFVAVGLRLAWHGGILMDG
jgi:hypothetical protein